MSLIDTHTAIVGTSGAGKTTTARVQVEQLLHDRRHVCIIDPTGVWWGLRSNAAGDGPGFDIPIFGGSHGDVPIRVDLGEQVGQIIANGVSAVVDVSDMDGAEQRRFVLDLMRALRRKPKANFHLVVDEADEFAPQTAPDNAGFALVEEMKWVAKRGRVQGFVLTAITQRPADISKAVLSQVQTVIAHQLIAPQDLKAIDAYLSGSGTAEARKAVMGSLPKLRRGERWIYSPRLDRLEQGVTELPATFDSSRTPEPGEMPVAPKMLAQIDLSAIKTALAPVEEAKAESPWGNFAQPPHQCPNCAALRREIERLNDEHTLELATGQQQLDNLLNGIASAISTLEEAKAGRSPIPPLVTVSGRGLSEADLAEIDRAHVSVKRAALPEPVSKPAPATTTDGAPSGLSGPQQRILDALAWWRTLNGAEAVTNEQAAFIAGYSPTSSAYTNPRGALKSQMLVHYPSAGYVALSSRGEFLACWPDTPPTGEDLRQRVLAKLSGPQQRVLGAAIARYPEAADNETIAAAAGYSASSSAYTNPRGSLKSLALISYPAPGQVRAADWLFP